jgi:hypothetical protein
MRLGGRDSVVADQAYEAESIRTRQSELPLMCADELHCHLR